MGNSLRLLCGHCCNTTSSAGGRHGGGSATAGFYPLGQDILRFDITSQVPQGLSKHVEASKKAQAKWYGKLSAAWKQAKRPPTTAEEAAWFVVQTLKGHQKQYVEGLLAFYDLPWVPTTSPDDQKVKFELLTLPVDRKAVADGDTVTVYVDTELDPREDSLVPQKVKHDMQKRSYYRARKNYKEADALHDQIIECGYRVFGSANNGTEILAHKYKIQLRGVDAPKCEMPYGEESKKELTKLVEGKCLRVVVFGEDQYGRYVSDVYSSNNRVFIQKEMIKRGSAKHFTAYDNRPQLASWEHEAKQKRLGLWALPYYMRS